MTPLERAARALAQALAVQEPRHGGTFHVDATTLTATIIDGTFDLTALARAVIEAIREPTDGMIAAARRNVTQYETEDEVRAYQAMIAELLGETRTPDVIHL